MNPQGILYPAIAQQATCPAHGLFRRMSMNGEESAACPNCGMQFELQFVEGQKSIWVTRMLPFTEATGQIFAALDRQPKEPTGSDGKKRMARVQAMRKKASA